MPSVLSEQSLYVMQNEFGLIKIGRSIRPEERRQTLQSRDRCRIELVLVREKEGHREEEFHIQLAGYRLAGEWFDGGDEARAAIASLLSPDVSIKWPFGFVVDTANTWLEEFWERESSKIVPREVGRMHGYIRAAMEPSWVVDSNAWDLYWLMEIGDRPTGRVDQDKTGEVVVTSWIEGELLRVPRFSQDIEAALSLWPPGMIPEKWEGSALECCKAGLDARRAWWKARNGITRGPAFKPAARSPSGG